MISADKVELPKLDRTLILGLELEERLKKPVGKLTTTDRGAKRIEKWRSGLTVKDNFFRNRLTHEGVTEEELLYLLSEDDKNLFERLHAIPNWSEKIISIYTHSRSDTYNEDTAPGFARLFAPLLLWGRETLASKITDLTEKMGTTLLDGSIDLLYEGLPQKLANAAARTLTLELHIAGLRGLLVGSSPEDRFESFLNRIDEQDAALELLHEYPVLARYAMTCIDQWVESCFEMVNRLILDEKEIARFIGFELGNLAHISGGAGDSHRGGRCVYLLTFSTGARIVYKPRPLAIDEHFEELINWLNAKGDHPNILTPRLINMGDYGWSEFIEKAECRTEEEIRRFYERQGVLLALFHGLHATDFHHENLIAAGEYPVPIDLESIFHPSYETLDSGQNDKQSMVLAGEKLASSVLSIGLLPQRIWATDEDKQGVEISGLGGKGGQLSTFKLPAYENIGTDKMVFTRKQYLMEESQNLPKLNGSDIYLLDYEKELIEGFEKTYRLLARYKDELLKEVLPIFRNDEVRYIARGTAFYDMRLAESFHPDLQRDALDRLRFFDNLWLHSVDTHLEKLVHSEIKDFIRGDIPYFTTKPGVLDVFDSEGNRIPKLFANSGLQNTAKILEGFSENDLAYQVWIIRSSLATLFMGNENNLSTLKGENPRLNVEILSYMDGAKAIGDRLLELAVLGEEDIAWLGINLIDEKAWHLQAIGPNFYDGVSGITLFLAYLGKLTGEGKYTQASVRGLRTLQSGNKDALKALEQAAPIADWPLGVFSNPLTSAIYVQVHLAELWDQPELLEEIEKFVDPLVRLVGNDDLYDVISGSAGLLLALLTLYSIHPSSETLTAATLCGEHIVSHASEQRVGIAWLSQGEGKPLTGMSHGASGIAMALFRLASVTNREDFYSIALAATEYERSTFSEKYQNWPDYRDLGSANKDNKVESSMRFWCHGAPGIGLARVDMLEHSPEKALSEDLQVAISSAIVDEFGANHSLCHGDLGNIDFLLTAGLHLDDESLISRVYELAKTITKDINLRGGLCGVPFGAETPGLMTGIAGIGYQLLRLNCPDKVPSVLLLQPPVKWRSS